MANWDLTFLEEVEYEDLYDYWWDWYYFLIPCLFWGNNERRKKMSGPGDSRLYTFQFQRAIMIKMWLISLLFFPIFIFEWIICISKPSAMISNTVIVCYTETPKEFEVNHPQLSSTLVLKWARRMMHSHDGTDKKLGCSTTSVYPCECSCSNFEVL